ncbi:carbohydrate kinase family protein [Aestuariibaculum sediminum]|uniref:Carbohydrate kinase n=1 Tax=Aestuariibaculum sediminum TaxID=2770637 RepID=A0A8J6UEA8_9FLAO|nr:carbohydrate kinase [Aestuariibaculum sediminum]MBD0830581.1 carbohydrate kinase [Aestuariibaculum sediminum]
MANIVCYGEILFDVFSKHRKIGGAPLNVASRLQSFNHEVTMISAVGNDAPGSELINYLKTNNINTENIQITKDYATSEVHVTLNEKGSATYNIMHPCAWDKIELHNDAENAVKKADAFVFGSLVARDYNSKNTLYKLLESAKYKIFDLNLRPPHYTKDLLVYLMNKADFIKFNDDELFEVCMFLDSKYKSLEQNLMFIAEQTNTKHICVTKGPHGAVLLYNNKLYYNSGFLIKVVDTVGAGDSFLASLISKLLNNTNPQEAIDFACGVGALVAQNEGANPPLSNEEIDNFINPK